MFKKIMSAAVALCVSCTMFSSMAFAASSFSDVISPDYDWAMNEINEMTTLGIIKGYTDGTFRPANSVRKIETLIFLARACGYSNEDYAPFAEYANTIYADVLDRFDLGASYNSYKPEVAFLLYKGVLKTNELAYYLDDASESLKRYETAVLLTKLMGAEEQVQNNAAVVLDYSDYADIPASSRAYVEYVTQKGLMNGIEDNCFGPNENVTRVQIAILLRRILTTLDYTTVTGTVSSVSDNVVTLDESDEYTIDPASVTVRKNGIVTANLTDISEGSRALLLYSGNTIEALEILSSEDADEPETQIISGVVDSIAENSYSIALTVLDNDETTHDFTINSDFEIVYNGKDSHISELSKGDYITVTTANGTVAAIDAESADDNNDYGDNEDEPEIVEGTVRNVTLTPEYALQVRIVEEDGRRTVDYEVSEDVSVTRNDKRSQFRNIVSGDSVTLTLTDGVITDIVAEGEDATENGTVSGTISSILISSTPQIGIEIDGEETLYPASSKISVTIDNQSSTIYNLSLGTAVEAVIKNGEITSVKASVASSGHQKNGIIEEVDTKNEILVLNIGGSVEGITVDTDSAAIINGATGKSVSFSRLRIGQLITAVGSYEDGEFVAKAIVVVPTED